jgi:hypothetical protein
MNDENRDIITPQYIKHYRTTITPIVIGFQFKETA